MDYFHGARVEKVERSVATSNLTTADSSIHFIVGTAPTHTVNGKNNVAVMVSSFNEAVKAVGYSEDWGKYDICEEIYTNFVLYNGGPVVIVNVLDAEKHLTGETDATDMKLSDGILELPLEALADKVTVKGYNTEEMLTDEYKRGVDYELLYTDKALRLERIEGGAITSDNAMLNIKYNAVDPSKVTKKDIIGGYDIETQKSSGFELVDSVFPKFRVVPTIFLAPNFSRDSEVAAVMAVKAESISGLFKGKAIIDIDTNEAVTANDAVNWKNKNGITKPTQLVCWPMLMYDGKKYHYSTHLAGSITATDNNSDLGGGTPCESASNKILSIDSMVLADETEVNIDITKANLLNANGIITALNTMGGFVSWGSETACYPSNNNPEEYFYNVSRMFDWVANTVILTAWGRIDRNIKTRMIESMIQTFDSWLNGLMAEGKIIGGRVEYTEAENTADDLANGIANFHIYLTPSSPAREMDFLLEYDTSYLKNLI